MAVDITRIAFATREYRSVRVEDLTVQTRHPLATELTYNTFLANETEAAVFGGFLLDLLKNDRYNWTASVLRENYTFSVGDTITIQHPRYGLSGGRNFIVKRIRHDTASPFVEVTLFGPEA